MTAPEDRDDARITYTVRELLAELKTAQTEGFMRIETALTSKADKADVARMEARLDNHANRLSKLEEDKHEAEVAAAALARQRVRKWTTRQKIVAVISGTLMFAATVVTPILAIAHV